MPIRLPAICDYHQPRSPLEKGLHAGDYLTWAFMPLQRIVPLRGTPSCAFGAALLQGPTREGLSHRGFYTAAANCASLRTLSCAFSAILLQGPTRGGLSHMRFHAAAANCASSRHSILRLWRGPSPRAYSQGIISHGLLYRCDELCLFEALHPAPLARPFSKGLLEGDYLTHAFMPLQRIVPLRGTAILSLWRGPSSRP